MNQTFKNLEHIVVDGASTDGTLEVIKAFEGTYDVSYISEPDTGIADALNKGLKNATGKYILIIQADDYLPDLHILEKVYPLLKSEDKDIYSFPVMMDVLGNGKRILKPIKFKWWNKFKFIFLHQGTFVHKRVYEQIGNFNTDYSIAMDYDFFYRALIKKPVIEFENFPVAEMAGEGIGSSIRSLLVRLKEEALVQKSNESNVCCRFIQTVFRFFYVPYKTRFFRLKERK